MKNDEILTSKRSFRKSKKGFMAVPLSPINKESYYMKPVPEDQTGIDADQKMISDDDDLVQVEEEQDQEDLFQDVPLANQPSDPDFMDVKGTEESEGNQPGRRNIDVMQSMADKLQNHKGQPSISSYNRATSIKFIMEKTKQIGDFDKASIFKKRSFDKQYQSVNPSSQRDEQIQKLNQAYKKNNNLMFRRSEQTPSEPFDKVQDKKVIETDSSEPIPEEAKVEESEAAAPLDIMSIKPPGRISSLKMTLVGQKIQQNDNLPTQKSLSINGNIDVDFGVEDPEQQSIVQQNVIKDLPIEFNFSDYRKNVRSDYLKTLGFDESAIKKMFQKQPSGYIREEGIDEQKISQNVKKQYDIYIDIDKLIEDFKNEPKPDSQADREQEQPSFEKYSLDEEAIRKTLLKKKKQQIRRVNQKSQQYISDRFLKFHLLQNLLYYCVLFIIPSVSVIDCTQGHSMVSYVAIGAFMLIQFIIDFVNLRQHIKKEIMKLNLKNFYGAHQGRQYLLELLLIYGEALFEIILTQLNLFDIYSDFAFITIVSTSPDLEIFFAMSMTSFILTMLPKIYSFWLIIKILLTSNEKYKNEPLLFGAKPLDDDQRRKMIFRAFTFSEFRSQALCVDYIQYEIFKTELLMSSLKFAVEDLPQFIIQVFYLLSTDCGVKNNNMIIYLSVFSSVLSSYCGFLFRIALYLYGSKRLVAFSKKLEVKVADSSLLAYGFKHIKRTMQFNSNIQALTIQGTNNQYFSCSEKRLEKLEGIVEQIPKVQNFQFLQVDQCSFDNVTDAQVFVRNILMHSRLMDNLKYLSLQRSRVTFTPDFIRFLQECNLVSFSFCLNSETVTRGEFESNEQPIRRKSLRYVTPDNEELSQMGAKQDFEALQILDAAISNQSLQVIQVSQCLNDYYKAYQYLLLRNHPKNDTFGRFTNENLQFQEDQRILLQKEMFNRHLKKREHIYERIYHNLSLNSKDYGISKLRRLEIRYLPLDPLMVSSIFRAMDKNVMLQELILTDDCLAHCGYEEFGELFKAMVQNKESQMCLLDIQRNYKVDDDLEIHAGMIETLLNQADRPKYLETFKLTTLNGDVQIAYMDLMSKEIEEVNDYHRINDLRLIMNKSDVKLSLEKIE